jgi:hypothetical protein
MSEIAPCCRPRQAQLEAKVREAEATWRSQLSASQNAIAQAAHDKQRLAAEATLTAVQVGSAITLPGWKLVAKRVLAGLC